jgi:hypothetical protein
VDLIGECLQHENRHPETFSFGMSTRASPVPVHAVGAREQNTVLMVLFDYLQAGIGFECRDRPAKSADFKIMTTLASSIHCESGAALK